MLDGQPDPSSSADLAEESVTIAAHRFRPTTEGHVMPYPRWLAQINKRVFNPGVIRTGRYPVVKHVGRVSGKEHQTPLDAFPTTNGYVLVCRYGPASDWVQNVLASREATLRVDGDEIPLAAPRLVALEDAVASLTTSPPPKDFAKAEHFVLMDRIA